MRHRNKAFTAARFISIIAQPLSRNAYREKGNDEFRDDNKTINSARRDGVANGNSRWPRKSFGGQRLRLHTSQFLLVLLLADCAGKQANQWRSIELDTRWMWERNASLFSLFLSLLLRDRSVLRLFVLHLTRLFVSKQWDTRIFPAFMRVKQLIFHDVTWFLIRIIFRCSTKNYSVIIFYVSRNQMAFGRILDILFWWCIILMEF